MTDSLDPTLPAQTATTVTTRVIVDVVDTLTDGEWVRSYPDAYYRVAVLDEAGQEMKVREGPSVQTHLTPTAKGKAKAFADSIADKAKGLA